MFMEEQLVFTGQKAVGDALSSLEENIQLPIRWQPLSKMKSGLRC